MIKSDDREFLKNTVEEFDGVYYPDDWIDSFNDIYTDIIEQALTHIEILWESKDYIIDHIYYNYSDTRIDLSVDKFLDKFPEHEEMREDLEDILY